MTRLVLTPAAGLDLTESRAWYKTQREGLELEFGRAVDVTLQAVLENPRQFALRRGSVRMAPLRKFRHGVFYRVLGKSEVVEVLAVLHHSRDPREWQKRR